MTFNDHLLADEARDRLNHIEDARDECAKISAAIEKRGGKIVWGNEP